MHVSAVNKVHPNHDNETEVEVLRLLSILGYLVLGRSRGGTLETKTFESLMS